MTNILNALLDRTCGVRDRRENYCFRDMIVHYCCQWSNKLRSTEMYLSLTNKNIHPLLVNSFVLEGTYSEPRILSQTSSRLKQKAASFKNIYSDQERTPENVFTVIGYEASWAKQGSILKGMKGSYSWAGNKVLWIQILFTIPEDTSSVPGTYMVETEPVI